MFFGVHRPLTSASLISFYVKEGTLSLYVGIATYKLLILDHTLFSKRSNDTLCQKLARFFLLENLVSSLYYQCNEAKTKREQNEVQDMANNKNNNKKKNIERERERNILNKEIQKRLINKIIVFFFPGLLN